MANGTYSLFVPHMRWRRRLTLAQISDPAAVSVQPYVAAGKSIANLYVVGSEGPGLIGLLKHSLSSSAADRKQDASIWCSADSASTARAAIFPKRPLHLRAELQIRTSPVDDGVVVDIIKPCRRSQTQIAWETVLSRWRSPGEHSTAFPQKYICTSCYSGGRGAMSR